MAEINLVPQEERSARNFEQLRRKLTLISTLALVISAVFTMSTLVFFISLTQERSRLINQIGESSVRINNLKAIEELLVVTKGKISSAIKIIDQRTNFPNFFEKISSLIPQYVSFSDMRFNAGKLVISGRAKTSSDMAGFVSSLVSAEGSKLVSDVNIDSLNSSETGIYSFVVSMLLAK
ncbi:PilN domain-containing protein [Candidatus Curtissbacteria bacterium]|nr:PilN domain-containing protein [Candidatus Curtissbacteria bacterium]